MRLKITEITDICVYFYLEKGDGFFVQSSNIHITYSSCVGHRALALALAL